MKNKTLALFIEGVPGFFGFFGFGWFYAGVNKSGLIWLLIMLGYFALELFLAVFTFGLSLLITVPIRLGILIFDLVKLSSHFNRINIAPQTVRSQNQTSSIPFPATEYGKQTILCPNCGSKVQPDSSFCANCGVAIHKNR